MSGGQSMYLSPLGVRRCLNSRFLSLVVDNLIDYTRYFNKSKVIFKYSIAICVFIRNFVA